MIPGFHCSCLDFHDPAAAVTRLAEMGFGSVAIRPRRGVWDPSLPWFADATATLSAAAKEGGLGVVVDLDAPFFDDPDSAQPFSLASSDERVRESARQQIRRWFDWSADLSPIAITFSTGCVEKNRSPHADHPVQFGAPTVDEEVLERLVAGIEPLARAAGDAGVSLALRPAADHAIATVAHFERFGQWLSSDVELGLAADVGEMLLGGEFPIGGRLARLQHRLTCVYLCEPDLDRDGDQRFGRGDIDLSRVWRVMTESGFRGPGIFRACGHGRLGFELAREAIALTQPED